MSNPFKPGSQTPFQAISQGKGVASAPPIDKIKKMTTPVLLPYNLYPPEDAETVDIANLFDVDPGATEVILRFVCPTGAFTKFQYYGIFNDGLLAADFDFFPTLNGRRTYKFHGDPLDNFRIYLGTAPDLSNSSLKIATLNMQPGDVYEWRAQNRSAVVTTMGVRAVGYVDYSQVRSQQRFGG